MCNSPAMTRVKWQFTARTTSTVIADLARSALSNYLRVLESPMTFRRILSCALFVSVAIACFGTNPKVDKLASLPTTGLSEALRQAVDAKGYRVTLEDGWTAEFWFVRELKTDKNEVAGALYPELSNGEVVGIVRFRSEE